MALFSFLNEAARDANGDAYGARLKKGLRDTMSLLASMSKEDRRKTLRRFWEKVDEHRDQVLHAPVELNIDQGRKCQEKARELSDQNIRFACAWWMFGAWTEGYSSPSGDAKYVHDSLEDLYQQMAVICEEVSESFFVGDNFVMLSNRSKRIHGGPRYSGIVYVIGFYPPDARESVAYYTAEKMASGEICLCSICEGIKSNLGWDKDYADIEVFKAAAIDHVDRGAISEESVTTLL